MYTDPYEKFIGRPAPRRAVPAPVVPRERVRPEPVKPDPVKRFRLAAVGGWPAQQMEAARARDPSAMEPQTVRSLARTVAKCSGVSAADILGKSRRSDFAKARHILTWLARRFTKASLPAIAAGLGRRDHTAVMHSVARVNLAIREASIPRPLSDTPEVWARLLWLATWPELRRRNPMKVKA
jgi:hypothetical protein